MSVNAIAFNRFGLGARNDDSPIAAAPARREVATALADYLEETRGNADPLEGLIRA